MSSVSSTSSSSDIISSYFSNKITGMYSGLDTESLIENAVSSYQTKITSLLQKQTKLQWKQDAYRSITDKLVELSQKYTSYTSSTNLTSPSFFSKNVVTTVNGNNASKVTASGKSTSELQINSVTQIATAARYVTSPKFSLPNNVTDQDTGISTITGSDAIDLSEQVDVSKMSGTLTLTYGTKTVDIEFGEDEIYSSAEELASAIKDKLSEQQIIIGSNSYKASDRINVSVSSDGTISFAEKTGAGNSVYISGASGDLEDTLGVTTGTSSKSISVGSGNQSSKLSGKQTVAEKLNGKTLTFEINGSTKSMTLGTYSSAAGLVSAINTKLGENSGVTASLSDDNQLTFTVDADTTFSMSSNVNELLGLSDGSVGNYVNTNMTLKGALDSSVWSAENEASVNGTGTLNTEDGKYYDQSGNLVALGDDGSWHRVDTSGNQLYSFKVNDAEITFTQDTSISTLMSSINSNEDAGVKVSYSKLTGEFVFNATETGADSKVEISGALGEALFGTGQPMMETLNGNEYYNADEFILEADSNYLLDSNGDRVTITDDDGKSYYVQYNTDSNSASYQKFIKCSTRGNPVIDEDTGELATVTEAETLAKGWKNYTNGQDAIFEVSVNGTVKQLTRSSNTVDLDGMSVTLKGAFDAYEKDEDGNYVTNKLGNKVVNTDDAITFSTTANSDTIVDAILSFVDEYNTILKEVHDAYSTQPAEKSTSTHEKYEPLTDEDKEDMSDSAIEAYEEKAKQGILFADTDLSNLYSRLRSTVSNGEIGAELRAIGISTTYDSGLTQLTVDEDALRAALDSDPDKVSSLFTDSIDSGASRNGLMATVDTTLDAYASTSIVDPGILVKKAGTTKSSMSLLDNTVQDQIDDIADQIETWQDKMVDKIDYYSDLFTQLETLMQELDSQSSALASLTGSSS